MVYNTQLLFDAETTSCCVVLMLQPALRGGALYTVEQRRLVVNGPLNLTAGAYFGAIARIPIFIQNASRDDAFGTRYDREFWGGEVSCHAECWCPAP